MSFGKSTLIDAERSVTVTCRLCFVERRGIAGRVPVKMAFVVLAFFFLSNGAGQIFFLLRINVSCGLMRYFQNTANLANVESVARVMQSYIY